MPFIPHTEADVQDMLRVIGASDIEDLFEEIPQTVRAGELQHVPPGISEMALAADMQSRAAKDGGLVCFLGAGCYDHHIPAAVWDITSRGEFMTAYTPYQAEASQGTLQLIYEYQSMMSALMAMDASNASVYDGGSGLAEAILMALRANRKNKSRNVLVPAALHPWARAAAENIVHHQGVTIDVVPEKDGLVDVAALEKVDDVAALVIAQPNFFGLLEDVDRLTDWAHEKNALVIAQVNPLAMSVLKPPGEWGETGADIACGEGQPLGIPMASGGPSFGFMCTKMAFVRQLPGRIIGRTEDVDGRTGYALTLQAREQHIRRGKATSNICTNQGLLVTAATIHMALMGPHGLAQAAKASHANTRALVDAATAVAGVGRKYASPFFHEAVLTLPADATQVRDQMLSEGLLAGLPMATVGGAGNELLVCATEKRTAEQIADYAAALARACGGAS